VRQALQREKRRGGQSFVVVPRVEDVAPVAETLGELTPGLRLRIAHGKLRAAEVDEALVSFAAGRGDVLLATSIIESGLDVPRANTMVVLRPDLFGLAQLHQLRGRVGRSQAQAYCYLMTEAGQELPEATARRLGTLQALDRLGAGMAISLQDLDLRGGGELFGERQAGHVRLIGLGLYQDLLAAAVRTVKGEPQESEDVALQAAEQGSIPEDYVPEPVVRVNIHHRIARTRSLADVDRVADEVADRFGAPPAPVRHLLAAARVRALARSLGVTRVSAGPQGAALSFAPNTPVETEFADALERFGGVLDWNGERMLYRKPSETPQERDEVVIELLEALA
jgi:transcription-repair coupling factor (superfamily II helicase)